ncbi:hypothetical protein F4805DRAFT_473473 [Annulohypoxylon moriforme]|nr:hypothetical protein F4805DRAFT_473473 [Annulohypoxylon moriforme]
MGNSNLKIPTYLPLTKGMLLFSTEIVHQELKIINGAEYTVKKFIPNPDASVYVLDTDIFVITELSNVVLVSSSTTSGIRLPGLPDGNLSLFTNKVYVSNKNQSFVRSTPFDRQGFTLTPTFVIIEFKARD